MVDGRHTGTGGGNHIILGGATPADSPFLRRPDLLRSFVSASGTTTRPCRFCFPVLFIGPTSQQPRIDEARHDSLYELEIAFAELERQTRHRTSPARRGWWTACSATCWWTSAATPTAPNSASTNSIRRTAPPAVWGLLEFRAFEMPPHARMSLAQQLLLRDVCGLVLAYPLPSGTSMRWGTRLHDRFMLPLPLRQADFNGRAQEIATGPAFRVSMDFFPPAFRVSLSRSAWQS